MKAENHQEASGFGHDSIAGKLAVRHEITWIRDPDGVSTGILRYFLLHCIGGGKSFLPAGLGAGVPVLHCYAAAESGRIETRRELVSERDPDEHSKARAEQNIRHYCLARRKRFEHSLLTREGREALLSEIDEGIQAVLFDRIEDFTKVLENKAPSALEAAQLGELMEWLTRRGIAVVVFSSDSRSKKGPPLWLDGLKCNMVSIEEDRKNPMHRGARLHVSRDLVDDRDCAPRYFTWWWYLDDEGKLECSCRDEHFEESSSLSPAQRNVRTRQEQIKTMIREGVKTQKEMAQRLNCDPATIHRDIATLVQRGEVLMDQTSKKLSLPEDAGGQGEDAPDAA